MLPDTCNADRLPEPLPALTADEVLIRGNSDDEKNVTVAKTHEKAEIASSDETTDLIREVVRTSVLKVRQEYETGMCEMKQVVKDLTVELKEMGKLLKETMMERDQLRQQFDALLEPTSDEDSGMSTGFAEDDHTAFFSGSCSKDTGARESKTTERRDCHLGPLP